MTHTARPNGGLMSPTDTDTDGGQLLPDVLSAELFKEGERFAALVDCFAALWRDASVPLGERFSGSMGFVSLIQCYLGTKSSAPPLPDAALCTLVSTALDLVFTSAGRDLFAEARV